jgi:hypothetical protein
MYVYGCRVLCPATFKPKNMKNITKVLILCFLAGGCKLLEPIFMDEPCPPCPPCPPHDTIWVARDSATLGGINWWSEGWINTDTIHELSLVEDTTSLWYWHSADTLRVGSPARIIRSTRVDTVHHMVYRDTVIWRESGPISDIPKSSNWSYLIMGLILLCIAVIMVANFMRK